MADTEEFDQELEDLFDDKADAQFGKASDGEPSAEVDPEPDVNDVDLEGAPEPTAEPEAEVKAADESDKFADLISGVVGLLLQATADDDRVREAEVGPMLDLISEDEVASVLLPATLRNVQNKIAEEELVEVLNYFAYRCSPLFETTSDVDRDNLSVQTRRFLDDEMEWSQVTPIEKVDVPSPPAENADMVSIGDLASEFRLAPSDVLEIAGLNPIDKSVSRESKISRFEFLKQARQLEIWCVAATWVEIEKDPEAPEAETDPKPEPQPEPPMPDDSDSTDDVEDDELAASTVAGRLGLNFKDVLKLADVTANEDGTPADGLSKVSLKQVSSEFEKVCVWVAAVKAETKPKPQPKPEPKKTDETPKPDESEVDDEAKAKAEAGQNTGAKPFDHAELDDDELDPPADPTYGVDWAKYEGEFEEGRDPKWRPKVEKTGDPVLDMINEDLALTESWDE